MATRSLVGIQKDDGLIYFIYVHFDGYPEYMLKTLTENYNSIELAEQILELGDLSSLGTTLKPPSDKYDHCDDVTVAYHRDRGEPLAAPKCTAPQMYATVGRQSYGADYVYWFFNGTWKYSIAPN